jgi:repressor LexA
MDKISPIKENILLFIDSEGITKLEFCEKTGISYANLKGKGLRSEIGGAQIGKILSTYNKISPEWLISGNGPMLKSDIPCATHSESNLGIPLIPFSAFAGIATGQVSVLEYECERYIIPLFKDAEFLIPIKGSSMIPKYSSGDIVACKKLSLSDIFFQWNKVYVLDTDQGVMVKRIHRSSDSESIKIVSENPKYEPFDLHISKIHAIAIVIGVVRLE